MTLHKNANPAFFHLIFLANLFSKDVGPWKLKWAPKFHNLGAHLAPKIFNKVSPLHRQMYTSLHTCAMYMYAKEDNATNTN